MRGAFVGLLGLLITSCIGNEAPMDPDTTEPEPHDLVADANGCHGTATLDGLAGTGGRASFGPHIFGSGRFCLHLDASRNRRAHLMIETDRFAGEHAPITLRLERPDGTLLADGSDVAFGQTDTKVFANLELAIEGGTEMDVVLLVEGAGVGSTIGAALFDPLE